MRELGELETKIIKVRSQEKLGEQDFHQEGKAVFESNAKVVTKTSKEVLEQGHSTTKTIAEVNESNVCVKTLKGKYKIGLFDEYLARPSVNLSKSEKKTVLTLR